MRFSPRNWHGCVLLSVLLISLPAGKEADAQGDGFPVGSRSAAMGRTSVALTDLWSTINNAAGLPELTQAQAGLAYEARFSMNELSSKALAAALPTGAGTLGLAYRHYGYHLYHEQQLWLSYGLRLQQRWALGVQISYVRASWGDGTGNKGEPAWGAGLRYTASDGLLMACYLYNPTGSEDGLAPPYLRLGMVWTPNEDLRITTEVQKTVSRRGMVVRAGLEYAISPHLDIRAGACTGEELFSMGTGLHLKGLQWNLSTIMHRTLGFSFQSSLLVRFQRKQ